ncbi:MAG: GNAT family N-acetyltransferase [Lachnospiraceae bacterium]|nr:GNAT family N-acetyltransferase [Lachnospiraceae bacterium]
MYQAAFDEYKKVIAQYASDPDVKIFVCTETGIKAGMLVLREADETPEIIGIAVSASMRGRGIGTYMIRQLMESEHFEKVKAQTDDDAIGFYRKCGFSEEMLMVEYPDGRSRRYNCTLIRR